MTNTVDMIVKDIEDKILNNTYKSGKKLASQADLSKLYECSNQRISNVYKRLLANKLVKYKRGVGYYIDINARGIIISSRKKNIIHNIKNLADSDFSSSKEQILNCVKKIYSGNP